MRKLKIEELNRLSINEYKSIEKNNLIVILDNVRSQFNVGSIFRICDAFRIKKLTLCGITPIPPSREIEKTALGSTLSVEWEYFKNTLDAIKFYKDQDYKIFIIEQTDESIFIHKFNYFFNNKICFVFGNEINGISDEILNHCDAAIEIPQFGTKHSFNVSISVAIVLYDFYYKNNLFNNQLM